MGSRGRLLISVALAAAVLAAVAGAAVARAPDTLEEAREERARVQDRLDRAAAELADLQARVGRLDDRRERLRSRADGAAARARRAGERIDGRVRDLYKRGGGLGPLAAVLSGASPGDAVERAALIGHVVADDRVRAEAAAAARQRARAAHDRLATTRRDLRRARADLEGRLETLRADLEEARRLEERLEQRRERRRRARAGTGTASSTPAPTGAAGLACPVATPRTYSDTWGAPRSGGRGHEGTDILAPYGTAVHAITAGTWDVMPRGASAGNWAILHGADGTDYWYLHLQSHVAADGAGVAAGQQVATNGDTGNADGTPHLHFEVHPGGGGPVNPYPIVRRVCG